MTRAADANTNAKACRELIRSDPVGAAAYSRHSEDELDELIETLHPLLEALPDEHQPPPP